MCLDHSKQQHFVEILCSAPVSWEFLIEVVILASWRSYLPFKLVHCHFKAFGRTSMTCRCHLSVCHCCHHFYEAWKSRQLRPIMRWQMLGCLLKRMLKGSILKGMWRLFMVSTEQFYKWMNVANLWHHNHLFHNVFRRILQHSCKCIDWLHRCKFHHFGMVHLRIHLYLRGMKKTR